MGVNKIESNTLGLSCQNTSKPTPISTSNRYAIFSEDDNNEATVLQSNKLTKPKNPPKQPKRNAATHTRYTTAQLKIAENVAVADAGATGHFVLPGTPVTNIKI